MKIIRHITGLFCAAVLATSITSCLDGNDSETIITNYSNAIVTAFSLENNADVCSNLSGYKFTIDNYGFSDEELHRRFPNDGIIFNPDSLPAGTIPDSVKVDLTFASPDSVYFKLYDPWGKLCQYSNFANDSALYFASYSDCRLTLVSSGGPRKTYHIKVNVHKVKGDTIPWAPVTDELWSDMKITDQRTDTLGPRYCWYVEEDGQRNKVSTAAISDAKTWTAMTAVTTPDDDLLDLSTLYNWHNALYAIGKQYGKLLTTTDGIHWTTACPELQFQAVLGNQCKTRNAIGQWNRDSLNAIVKVDGKLRFATSANAQQWNIEQEIPENFPIRGFSRPIWTEARSNYGNLTSRLYITGGVTSRGELVAGTWSCDGWDVDKKGVNWVAFEQGEMPAMQGATVIEYTLDKSKPKSFWILYPGTTSTGKVPSNTFFGKPHATIYFSEDYGVSWHRLSRRYTKYADNSSLGELSCSSGFCNPDTYKMYFFGGRNADGSYNTHVWGAILNSLTFDLKK